jgi:hypothetical protein
MDGNPRVVSVWDGCLSDNVNAPSRVLHAVNGKEPCHYIEGAALQSVSVASGTNGVRMAKAKKSKPRERLVRWRVSLIKGTPAKFIDYVEAPNAETAEKQVAEEHKIPDTLRDRLVAIREDW